MELTPEHHLRLKKGCIKCSEKAKSGSPEKFLKRAKEKFGNRFDYTELRYMNTKTKVNIRCKKHNHRFMTLPSDHLRYGSGVCKYCGVENRKISHGKDITVEGVRYPTFRDAANHYGIDRSCVYARIKKWGWDIDKAFTIPMRASSAPITIEGVRYQSLKKAAEVYGISAETAGYRLKNGWDAHKAFTTPSQRGRKLRT